VAKLGHVPKTLVLMRHAQAASPDGVADHERPLTERGRRDAAAAGRWLRSAEVTPHSVIVSSAVRTRETFDLLRDEAEPTGPVRVSDHAYAASAGELLELVRGVPAQTESLLVVGHNPSIGMLARLLDDGGRPGEAADAGETAEAGEAAAEGAARAALAGSGYPTAALAVFAVEEEWASLNPGEARLVAFAVPRA
jgi:phosphohistidine phosphatase